MNGTEVNISKEERMFMYQLLCHYYREELVNLSFTEWKRLVEMIITKSCLQQNEWGRKVISQFQNVTEQDLETFEYDYNRLFVGPNKLLASPYESTYLEAEGSVMQGETMKVRNFYYYEGLQVADEGTVPDDHIQFELEFMLFLADMEEKQEVLKLFLEKHLLNWCPKHCDMIVEHSQNSITLAFGYLLKGFLQLEKRLIESEVH
jgi:putative dimethyl sulfoxide reductase chaperone